MNFNDPRFYLDVLVIIFSVANILVTWLRKPGQEAKEDVKKLSDHVDAQNQKINTELAVLRERMEHMPTDKELETLAGAVKSLEATQEALAEGQRVMTLTLNRIETHLLSQK